MNWTMQYPNIAATCRFMTTSSGARFADDVAINAAIAGVPGTILHRQGSAQVLQYGDLDTAEADLARFAAEHAFGHQWAGEGQDDEGDEAPISGVTDSVLEAIYA